MDRRHFLIGGLAVSAASTAPELAWGAHLPARIIDAHCHVFNAADLPMVKFIEQVFLRTSPLATKYPTPIDAILKEIATRLSNGVGDEERYLDTIKLNPHNARNPDAIKESERNFLIALFAEWQNHPGAALKPGAKLIPKTIAAFLPRIVLGFVRREVSHGNYSGPLDLSFGSALDNSDHAFDIDPTVDTAYLAREVYDHSDWEVDERSHAIRVISRSLKWVVLFTRYRREMLQQLHLVNQGRAVLATPAIVDFAKWLDSADPTPLSKQATIMERLARERPDDTPHMHGFIAFDPLRQAIDEKLGKPEQDQAFSIARKAILEQGFIGIKLYPPMGFRITNNAGAGNDFPCWVRFGSGSPGYDEKCEGRRNTQDGLGDTPGQLLDDALWKLFAWCADNNAPVMAHVNNTNAAGPGYETRANPSYWRKVFAAFPALHVNMAHFGGFEEAFVDEKLQIGLLEKTWEWSIGRMIEANTNLPLFADVSYLSEVLAGNAKLRRDALTCMTRFKDRFANSDKFLMYGTDWSMIGHEPNFTAAYPELVADFLYQVGYRTQAELDNIFFRNAVRFLGLSVNDREKGTRGRLERFHQANAGWMTVFD